MPDACGPKGEFSPRNSLSISCSSSQRFWKSASPPGWLAVASPLALA